MFTLDHTWKKLIVKLKLLTKKLAPCENTCGDGKC
uniref:Uncharacterized protein n=1 Tax=uncultured bacterium BLR12 TaxID=506514 RepID=C0IND1_9BACT|nr:hypothetical protein AKSOIL_0202 [uncultured bacterium BLR12]